MTLISTEDYVARTIAAEPRWANRVAVRGFEELWIDAEVL